MKKLIDAQIEQLISQYKLGATPTELSKSFGIHPNSISRLLRKNNIIADIKPQPISDDNIKKILLDFDNKISIEIIANNNQMHISSIYRILKKNNCIIKQPTNNIRKIKNSYFSTLDTENKAYFAGLILFAGIFDKDKLWITLPAHNEVIKILSKELYGTNKVAINDSLMTLELSNKNIINDLNIKTFPAINNELAGHFLRGILDGTSLSTFALNKGDIPRIDWFYNKVFLESLSLYLTQYSIQLATIINYPNNKGHLQVIINKDLKQLIEIAYKNASIFLSAQKSLLDTYLQSSINHYESWKNYKYIDNSKYGSYYLPIYNGKQLSENYIKSLPDIDKKEIGEYLIEYYQSNSFPQPKLTDNELIKEYHNMKEIKANTILTDKILNCFNPAGLAIFKHFAPHFFDVKYGLDLKKPSLIEAFNNSKHLKKTILNRLDQGYGVNGNMLRQGLANSRTAFKASIFNIMVGKTIYEKYLNGDGTIIYDYSMGFGNRLLGVLALKEKIKYIGTDPMQKSVDSNKAIFDFYQKNMPGFNKEAEFHCIGAENYCQSNYINKIDIAFSSPPYFYQEIYENKEEQSYYNRNYSYFLNTWWNKVVSNIKLLLKDDGIFILNMKENMDGLPLAEDMVNIAKMNGFELIDILQMQLTRNVKFNKANNKHRYEPIFIMKKV